MTKGGLDKSRSLPEQQALFELVLDSISDAIVVADAQGRFLFWNPKARLLAPPGPTSAGPDSWPEVYHILRPDRDEPFPADQLPLVRAIRGEEVDDVEVVIEDPTSGRRSHITASARPLRDASGRVCGGVVVFRDLTDRLRMEREIRRSNEALQAYAHSVSHDLKSPLLVIQGFAEALADEFGRVLGATGAEYVQHIQESAGRMRRLIDDLLGHAHLGQAWQEAGPVDLGRVVQRALEACASEIDRAGAQVRIAGRLPTLLGHEAGLLQIVHNLVGNAVKFVAAGKRPEIEVGCKEDERSWVLWIKDNGIGIEPIYHDTIFELFRRLHPRDRYPGTGVGLALVKKAAELHRGSVHVESAPGRGSTFRVRLPKCLSAPLEPGG